MSMLAIAVANTKHVQDMHFSNVLKQAGSTMGNKSTLVFWILGRANTFKGQKSTRSHGTFDSCVTILRFKKLCSQAAFHMVKTKQCLCLTPVPWSVGVYRVLKKKPNYNVRQIESYAVQEAASYFLTVFFSKKRQLAYFIFIGLRDTRAAYIRGRGLRERE